MIATLSGIVSEKLTESIVLDVGGVGYDVRVTLDEYSRVATGAPAKFYIYEHIKEDTYDLFGFSQITDKQLFVQLLSVKNVGPKVAVAVLGLGASNDVRAAIAGGDVKRLQSAKGVGKRAAEQIVVELRDKVGLVATDSAEGIVTRSGIGARDEAEQALIALGYSEADASLALRDVDPSLPTEERITQALRQR